MSAIRDDLADYVALRRQMGFALKEADHLLPSFVGYLEEHHLAHVSIDAALAWAAAPVGVLAVTTHQRLGVARAFAHYLNQTDPVHQVPPADLLPGRYHRVRPYLYSEAEIAALVAAASQLSPRLRAITYMALIGLLAVSGIRLGEAVGLDDADIDAERGVLKVSHSKRGLRREVPLHPSTLVAMAAYGAERDSLLATRADQAVFVSTLGTRISPVTVEHTYRALRASAGLGAHQAKDGLRAARLHDLRHSFAVQTLITWHRQGIDIDTAMPALSKVMGHASPASTYWYYSDSRVIPMPAPSRA